MLPEMVHLVSAQENIWFGRRFEELAVLCMAIFDV